ncbi:hypothetical protein ACFSCX_13045 [Bacillus salitolerans]|uniref:Uncharacterized protein n=1 Tax=Bacillus salitolerans TaxID=1437434 RepID=A0ABW4LRJ3_9BACI
MKEHEKAITNDYEISPTGYGLVSTDDETTTILKNREEDKKTPPTCGGL